MEVMILFERDSAQMSRQLERNLCQPRCCMCHPERCLCRSNYEDLQRLQRNPRE